MKRFLFLGALISTFFFGAKAQDWYQMHVDYDDYEWKFPVNMTHVSYFDFNSGQTVLQPHFTDDENVVIPFSLEASKKYGSSLTTMTLSNELTEWGKNKHKVFAVYITTDDGSDITSKEEYTPCYISVDGMGEYPDHSMHGKIRGRGNSTWEWYDKKPYRIKFDVSSKVLGIKKNKDWVLLANYRDVTKVMNTFASITADWMGLPFTTPVRFAELFINGEYKGIYQIAEQVEVGGNRVAIDEMEGLLLTLDVDDGPGNNPGAGDNFWTKVYNMPMAVKNSKNLTADQLNDVREQFAELEQAIKSQDYEAVDNLMDIGSYIRMIQLQEYLYNVELSAPRSVFLFRDKGGKFTFGPAWDWDAGFDFEWSDMYTGHTYFANYRETLLGSRPYDRNGTYKVSHFFTDLFGVGDFVRLYKSTWENFSDSIFIRNWEETQKYIDGINEYQQRKSRGPVTPSTREADRWPIRNFNMADETAKMKTWLKNRAAYVNTLVANYPEPDGGGGETQGYTVVGTLSKSYTLQLSSGYSQSVSVTCSAAELAPLLGVDASTLTDATLDLVPLNADGSEGDNTAAKTYGAWFDEYGDTNDYSYGDVRVYIESDNLFRLNCGCHPDNCDGGGEQYTVTLQYRHLPTQKAVNLKVTFTVEGSSWWWNW